MDGIVPVRGLMRSRGQALGYFFPFSGVFLLGFIFLQNLPAW